jgi:hypothetical protein
MGRKKKKLENDQYITSGYIDFVPGSEKPFFDSSSIKDRLVYINEYLNNLNEKNNMTNLHTAYKILKEQLGLNESYEQCMERF